MSKCNHEEADREMQAMIERHFGALMQESADANHCYGCFINKVLVSVIATLYWQTNENAGVTASFLASCLNEAIFAVKAGEYKISEVKETSRH